jgi:hypothetical protein
MTEIGWADGDGDKCHILLGRENVADYLPGSLEPDVVGLIEVQEAKEHDHIWHAVLLDRSRAEILHRALSALLEGDAMPD